MKGRKNTAIPMVITVATSWGLGFPTTALLGFNLGPGGPGVWTGAAWFLVQRFRRQAGRFMAEA